MLPHSNYVSPYQRAEFFFYSQNVLKKKGEKEKKKGVSRWWEVQIRLKKKREGKKF